jgi:hypothetical protein
MIINFDEFGGISPRYNPRRLPMPFAKVADNCKMDRGQLRGFAGSLPEFQATTLIASLKSIFVYKPQAIEYLLQFPNFTSVVGGANPSDIHKRVYWTEDGTVPQMGAEDDIIAGVASYPFNSYDLGVPIPTGDATPSRVITGNSPTQDEIDDGTATPSIRAYTYTYVTDYGEESAPYVPAGDAPYPLITLYEGDEVLVSGMSQVPGGNHPFNPVNGAKKRVYQTDLNGNFRLVAEIPLVDTTFQGVHTDFDATPVMNTQILIGAQPLSDMEGLVFSRAGFMLGFVGNTLYRSSPSLPHNWPVINQDAVPFPIQGLVPTSQGVLVITDSAIYVAMGNDPSNLSIVDVDTSLGCVSKESIVDMGDYAVYASQNGLVAATASTASIVTEDIVLPLDWTAFSPETMRGFRHLHRLILMSDTDKFVVNPRGTTDRLVNFDVSVVAGLNYNANGHLLYTPDGVNMLLFDVDINNPLAYTWVSATYTNNQPVITSCYKIDADDFDDLTLQVTIDGVPLYSGAGLLLNPAHVDPQNGALMYGRLPVFRPGFDVTIELSGSSPVNKVSFSDTFEELINE